MTTLTAPRHTSRRFRTSTALIGALAVVGISAAVAVPRLMSTTHTVTPQVTSGTSTGTQTSGLAARSPGGSVYASQVPALTGLVGVAGPAQQGAVRDGGRAESHQYGARVTTPGYSEPAPGTVPTHSHPKGHPTPRFHRGQVPI